jgi:putative multiple sugar transport system permease protein
MTTVRPTLKLPTIPINLRQYGILAAFAVIVVLFQVLTDGRLLLPGNINNWD